jgi:hypothetical protein
LTNCALLEHFIDYREIVRDEIYTKLADYQPEELTEKVVAIAGK